MQKYIQLFSINKSNNRANYCGLRFDFTASFIKNDNISACFLKCFLQSFRRLFIVDSLRRNDFGESDMIGFDIKINFGVLKLFTTFTIQK